MSADFWYPWFPQKFHSDTRHLTDDQDLIYRRLLDEYMLTREPLPNNDIALAKIARVSENKWLDAKRILSAYFRHAGRMLHHDFCDKILDSQDKRAKRLSEGARNAAEKRWKMAKKNNTKKQEDVCAPHTESMPGDAISTNTKKEDKENPKENVFELPPWVPAEPWKAFLEMRKSKKEKPTEYAKQLLVGKLEKLVAAGDAAEEIINQSIERGYTGFFPVKKDNSPASYSPQQKPRRDGVITLLPGVP